MLDDGEKPKYGVRPEAMCSQSIDIVTGITASFCYRTDNETFLSKTSGSTTFSASFHATSEKESTDLGRKVGVDRKGNIIRLKSEKNLDEADSAVKYHGQFQTSWFRVLSTKLQKSYLEDAQGCSRMLSTYGKEEVMSGKVMARFKTLDEFKTYRDILQNINKEDLKKPLDNFIQKNYVPAEVAQELAEILGAPNKDYNKLY